MYYIQVWGLYKLSHLQTVRSHHSFCRKNYFTVGLKLAGLHQQYFGICSWRFLKEGIGRSTLFAPAISGVMLLIIALPSIGCNLSDWSKHCWFNFSLIIPPTNNCLYYGHPPSIVRHFRKIDLRQKELLANWQWCNMLQSILCFFYKNILW